MIVPTPDDNWPSVWSLARKDIVVLGLPRGGVPVAFEVAKALRAPLDVLVVRKLGVPFQPELAFGAIGEGGVRVINDSVVRDADRGRAMTWPRSKASSASSWQRRVERFRRGHDRISAGGASRGTRRRRRRDRRNREGRLPGGPRPRREQGRAGSSDRRTRHRRNDLPATPTTWCVWTRPRSSSRSARVIAPSPRPPTTR